MVGVGATKAAKVYAERLGVLMEVFKEEISLMELEQCR